jgi:hypothetical protein
MAISHSLNIGPRTTLGRIKDFFRAILRHNTSVSETFINETMFQVWEDLVDASPWWSGATANSWTLSTDTPRYIDKSFSGKTENYYGYPETPAVRVIPVNEKTGKLMGQYYVANGVPYIELLNEGYSAQAAPGWIETTIQLTLNRRS